MMIVVQPNAQHELCDFYRLLYTDMKIVSSFASSL